MIEDQILAEKRKIKDDLASQYGYEIRKMLNDAIERQNKSEHRVVNLIKKKGANQSVPRNETKTPKPRATG